MCHLIWKELNDNQHIDGLPWTFPKLVHIGMEVSNGTRLKGVKQEPWWPIIKFEHHMVPLLCCLIGIGNNCLTNFVT